MKKTIFIFFVIVFSLLYYLGFLTKKDTLPLSKEFFSAESSSSMDQALDLKGVGGVKSKMVEGKPLSFDKKELDQIFQMKLDRGIRNFSNLSLWLVREAKKVRKAGDPERAIEWVTYANRFSPDLPQPYFELARTSWQQKPFQLNEVLPEMLKGYRAQFSHYPSSLNLFYQAFYILSNAVLMAFIIFGIIILLKYFSLYFYDIRKNLTQEISSLLNNGLKIFVLFIPLFLRLDILWAILFWSILLWGYVPKRERQFVLAFLIILVYLPFFLRLSSSFLNGGASDVVLEMNEANHENWDRGTEEKLKAWSIAHPDDPEVLFTLGLIEKRQGRYSKAEEFYRRAIERNPNSGEVFSNLGNVYLAQKQIQLAIASYEQAIKLNPNNGAYYYNLYRAYSQETFLSARTDRAFQKARHLNPALIDYYSMIDSPNMNRLVIDEVLPTEMLWERFLTQLVGREGLLFRLFKAWFERIPSAIPFLAPILFLAFLIGMSRYTRAKRFLTRCPMCGSATHRFYLTISEAPEQEFVCFNCYRLFVQKEKLHPKIMEKKSLQADQFQRQSHFTGKFLSYFFVGFNDLWRGSSFKGLVFLFIFFIFILRLIFWDGVLPDPILQPSFSWWGAFFWGGLFILFYILSIRRLRRQKPEFEVHK
ncbi:MAG: tetratricopeptide repeat protein [Thermodesulfobacteriota bacterium]|nr:tetratricopeptide repeat protein [Thermodesulfobacteriota bacterium]